VILFIVWIAIAAGGIAAVGGLVLAGMCARQAPKFAAILFFVSAALAGTPIYAHWLLQRGWLGTSSVVALLDLIVSVLLIIAWPGLVSAAGQP
jgi:hypothetical protein